MAHYPDSFVEEVRERADLLAVVGRYVLLKKQGSNWMGLCPFHNEKTPSFNVHPGQGFYHCFGCGVGGDIFGFLMKIKGLSFPEAIEEVAIGAGLTPPEGRHEEAGYRRKREERQSLLEILDKARHWFCQRLQAVEGGAARAYLQRRGVSAESIERFALGYAPPGWRHLLDHFGGGRNAESLLEKAGLVVLKEKDGSGYDRFRDRIIFPIQDYRGRCIGFGGRLLAQGEPKYINSPETLLYRKGEVLYGMDQAQQAIQREERVLVVEGYMDLVALANHGVNAVVATLGTALTAVHLRHLWKRTRRICFCFDGDAAGRKAAWRAVEQVLDGLEPDRHAHFLFLPEGMDPDDFKPREGAEGFRTRWAEAVPLMTFFFRHLAQGLNTEGPEGRAAMVHRARPLLAKVADPLLRELYGDSLGQYLGMDRHQVRLMDLSGAARPGVEGVARASGQGVARASGQGVARASGQGVARASGQGVARASGQGVARASGQGVARASGHIMARVRPNQPKPWATGQAGQTAAGRDFEQALVAMVLRDPELVVTHEEALSCLDLENPQLSDLLSALLDSETRQAHASVTQGALARGVEGAGESAGEPEKHLRLRERLPTAEMVAWAREILLAEETTPEWLQEEFSGSLLSCQLRHLQRQIDQTTREIATMSGDTVRQFGVLQALKQEQKRLRQRKCRPVLSETVDAQASVTNNQRNN